MSVRSQAAIIKDMGTISRFVFNDIKTYCKYHSMTFEEFLAAVSEKNPILTQAWMNSAEVAEWLEPPPEKKTPPPSGRLWFYKGQPSTELAEQSVELLAGDFICARVGGYWQAYLVVDRKDKIIESLSLDKELRTPQRLIKEKLWEDGEAINTKRMQIMWDYFQTHSIPEPEPKALAQPDEDVWCFSRVKTRPDPSVPFPHIRELLDRLDDPEAFAAWHYGVHSGKLAKGRQVLWLESPGEDGKSIWLDTFGREFGKSTAAMTGQAIKDPKFMFSQIVNKHFAYFADCKNEKLLLTEAFQTMASGGFDLIPIEEKYGLIYLGRVTAKWEIGSNFKPFLVNERYNLSRIIWITLGAFSGRKDPHIGKKWAREMPGFLAYGAECYAARCIDDYEIKVNAKCEEKMLARIADSMEEFDVILEKYFVIEPQAKLARIEMADCLRDYGLREPFKQAEFHKYLERQFGVVKRGKPLTYRGIRLRTTAEQQSKKIAEIRLAREVA